MSDGGSGWIDRLLGWCFSLLLGAIALYCAARLVEPVLPTLITIIGIMVGLGVVVGVVVVIRTLLNRW
ncbi:hypothetical protein [Mycolicibacterium cosmeticum]|uniref:hypothetical protein n=1 Tax=Mycolicibacterium cosmeticum TaxID=258533 RepID=UPI003204ADC2